MDNKEKSVHFARLIQHSEWKVFEDHIRECAKVHETASVDYSKRGNEVDAQRQAWISEGLVEAIEEPEYVVRMEKSLVGKVTELCRLCGNLLKK